MDKVEHDEHSILTSFINNMAYYYRRRQHMNDFFIFIKEKEKTFKQEYVYAEIPIYHQNKENDDKEDEEKSLTIIQII